MVADRHLDDPQAQHQHAIEQVPQERLASPPEQASTEKHDDFVRYIGPGILVLCVVAFAVLSPGLAFIALICLFMFAPCVILHELAHLYTARRAGMQVNEFSIGFGQRLLSREWKGITWSVKILPLGGAVEIAGMTVEDVEKDKLDPARAFIYKHPFSRIWVVLSGVLTNVILGWTALTIAVTLVVPHDNASLAFYIGAPVQGIYLLGVLLKVGSTSLANAAFDWTDPEVGSILSLPQGFASGAAETLSEGIPLIAYFALFFAALNISLALFNLLPLFPLDGFHGATAAVDQGRRSFARLKRAPFAPLTTWRMRWVSRSTGAALAIFVGSVFVRDIVKMM